MNDETHVSTPVKTTLCIFLHRAKKKPQPTPAHPANPACSITNSHVLPMESSGHPHCRLDCKGFGVSLPSILLISYSQVIEITLPFFLCLWPTMLCTMLFLLFFLHLILTTVYNRYDVGSSCDTAQLTGEEYAVSTNRTRTAASRKHRLTT